MKFDELALSDEVRQGIEAAGFTTLTPVQEATLPLALSGKDVAAQAQTGTGKTAAFLITIFQRIKKLDTPMPGRAPRAIVIAPTRELAIQILDDAESIGRFTGLECLAVYGGVDYQKQKESLEKGVDLLVGTPGRLIDYFKQKAFSLKYIEAMVIDEADRMFDMGFIADIRYMLRRMPPYDKRQSMLFSATLPWRVLELAYEHMNNPDKVQINPEQITVDKVEQTLFHVGRNEKLSLLLGLLRREMPEKSMLFVNTKREAEAVSERLNRNGFQAEIISGDLPQKKRMSILSGFKEGKFPILVATDVASRGLHVDGITHVFNYDLPQDAEDYVHRIGRTARAGATGKAYAFADEQYVFGLEAIEKYIGMKIPVSWPDEDMFVREKRRTAEEKRAADERDRIRREERAQLEERRRGRGRGGPRREGAAGRGRPPAAGPRPEPPKSDTAIIREAVKAGEGGPGPAAEGEKKPRKRRHRPKKKPGEAGAGGGQE